LSPAENSAQENSSSSDAETLTETPIASTQPAASDPQPATAAATPTEAPAQAEARTSAPAVAGLNAASTAQQSDLSQLSGNPNEQRIQLLQSLYQQRRQMTEDARKNPPSN
jgi:hypothetical protein